MREFITFLKTCLISLYCFHCNLKKFCLITYLQPNVHLYDFQRQLPWILVPEIILFANFQILLQLYIVIADFANAFRGLYICATK